MVTLTFPDGARRDYPQNTTGLDIAKGISPSLAKRTVAMALDGKVADLTDPPRRRACAGRGGADAVARHASHHRPGDRQRLLLRFFPQPAVHAGRLRRDRTENARDHRA